MKRKSRLIEFVAVLYLAISFCMLGIESSETWHYALVVGNFALAGYVNIRIDKQQSKK